jgi:hypothetical protein
MFCRSTLLSYTNKQNHNLKDLVDHYHTSESNLAKFLVPQVYDFPEFVALCASKYIYSKRTIISKDGFVLIEILASKGIRDKTNGYGNRKGLYKKELNTTSSK